MDWKIFLVFAKGEYDESGSPILRYGLEAILSLRKASTVNLTGLQYGLEAIFPKGEYDESGFDSGLAVVRYGLEDLLL